MLFLTDKYRLTAVITRALFVRATTSENDQNEVQIYQIYLGWSLKHILGLETTFGSPDRSDFAPLCDGLVKQKGRQKNIRHTSTCPAMHKR